MKILLVVKQKKNVDTFLPTIRELLTRGHAVTLAVQERDEKRDEQYLEEVDAPAFTVTRCPPHRTDGWAELAPLLRSLRDCIHYQGPELRNASKLQTRTILKLREELRVPGDETAIAEALRALPAVQVARLETLLQLTEAAIPCDPLYRQFLAEQAPDVLLLSPLVHFGSAQADLVVAARACAIPVGMLLFSWDNLSTKGALHHAPDWIFAWNEQQREEAATIHGFPRDRVVVAGAPRFDRFFTLRPQLTRPGFHEPLGLDPAQATLLYVCSSQFVSAAEMAFVRKWIAALRSAESSAVRGCNVIVRPHPDVRFSEAGVPMEELRWPDLRGLKGIVARPFGDPRAIVLRTSDRLQQGLYESIAHSAAVVGLNTSAELEAAIVGKPVYTVLAGTADADGQSSTLHFHYLVEGHGGCVRVANGLEQHIAQIEAELRTPSAPEPLRQFVHGFLRPCGIERPVAPLLAEAIEGTFASMTPAPMVPGPASTAVASAAHWQNESGGATVTVASPAAAAAPSVVIPVTFARHQYTVDIYAGDDGEAYKFDRLVVEWLREHVRIGDVLYDVDAGIGLYTLLAAKHRGATVIAFEPGFTAFKRLTDNVLLNGADGVVTALPLAVADFDGLGYLKYPPGQAGSERHSLRQANGVPAGRRAAGEDRPFEQSICTVSLDRAMAQYGLPQPTLLRLGARSQAAAILSGAAGLLSSTSLRTIFMTTTEATREPATAALAAAGWTVSDVDPLVRGRSHVIASRLVAAGTT